jgi:hypothetical protein
VGITTLNFSEVFLIDPTYEKGTDRAFRNVGTYNSGIKFSDVDVNTLSIKCDCNTHMSVG